MRSAKIIFDGREAGILSETEEGYEFTYFESYLADKKARPISLTLPLRPGPYISNTMLPFFDGLIPEGWLLDIAADTWKINIRDRMGLLLVCCKECIGAVSVIPVEENRSEQ